MSVATLPASITNLVNPTVYVSCADTAKLVRKSLKEAFPEIKFSVRSDTYSGGASIRVRWSEGPTNEQVDKIVNAFKGGDFDGMTDSMYYRKHALDGQPVSFSADFIFTHRDVDQDKLKALTSIFERADKADWLTLASRFDMAIVVLRGTSMHFSANETAYAILKSFPAPEFEGRRSKTAESANCLS